MKLLLFLFSASLFAQCSNPIASKSVSSVSIADGVSSNVVTVSVDPIGKDEIYWKLKVLASSIPETFVAYVTARKDQSTYISRQSGTATEIVVDQRLAVTIIMTSKSAISLICIDKLAQVK